MKELNYLKQRLMDTCLIIQQNTLIKRYYRDKFASTIVLKPTEKFLYLCFYIQYLSQFTIAQHFDLQTEQQKI
ncbi:hypothetical protein HZS_2307 [Henneguya salminicola]|nr:hypothetical protein HZS_2307 [Henneguya salminicola]